LLPPQVATTTLLQAHKFLKQTYIINEVKKIGAMKGTQHDQSGVVLSGRRNGGLQSRRGFGTLRSWLFIGIVAILATPAKAQIGDTVCACSPTVFNITLDFGLTCADANILNGDGIAMTDCSITPFQGGVEVESLVPVNVFSVDFLELDQELEVLNQRSSFVNLNDGDTISYESFSINPELVDEVTVPNTHPRTTDWLDKICKSLW
jgi:hypothetical protein